MSNVSHSHMFGAKVAGHADRSETRVTTAILMLDSAIRLFAAQRTPQQSGKGCQFMLMFHESIRE